MWQATNRWHREKASGAVKTDKIRAPDETGMPNGEWVITSGRSASAKQKCFPVEKNLP